MRGAVVLAALLLLAGVVLSVFGMSAAPLSQTCAEELDAVACDGAVSAVLRRGLPDPHPLILGAHVEPGSAPGADEFGHRATVSFDLLGVPGTTAIELYYDRGAHWGGESDRAADEIRAWSLAPLALGSILAAAVLVIGWRRRPRATA